MMKVILLMFIKAYPLAIAWFNSLSKSSNCLDYNFKKEDI
jgi:hypothetical protein